MEQLTEEMGYVWTGQSLQEKQSYAQASFLLALSMLVVLLGFTAFYETWLILLSE
ncbi:hypothetical protein [Acinetobacter johnsonii]|uniref:hypothetical protein n=1 Tax=Acinetobacter johnsonii TaxID=40214 RepID=UPI003019AFEC